MTSSLVRVLAVILTISLSILGFLFWLIYFYKADAASADAYRFLPALNATFNATSTVFIIGGIVAVKRRMLRTHATCMIGATISSACFLAGYMFYHAYHGDTKFLATGPIRPLYFFILITHIFLSMAVVPLILSTLYFAATRNFVIHARISRWTYPIWLYVSVTGIMVFVFLRYLNTP